jgi:hypothetical protein
MAASVTEKASLGKELIRCHSLNAPQRNPSKKLSNVPDVLPEATRKPKN